MRTVLILALLSFVLLSGCLFGPPSSPPSFLKRVDVDVLRAPIPDQFPLQTALTAHDFTVGDDLPVSVQLNLPGKELRDVSLAFSLYRADSPKPVRSATLSHLRAGDLKLTFSTHDLSPGSYHLDTTILPVRGDPITSSLPFTLSPKPSERGT